jgi:hypothetical protein
MEWLAAELSFVDKTETGKTTGIMHNTESVYFPLKINNSVLGIIGVNVSDDIKSNPAEIDFLRKYIKEIIPFIGKHSVHSIP